jgi:glycosyltransferase involved in cell wall biosynthesis
VAVIEVAPRHTTPARSSAIPPPAAAPHTGTTQPTVLRAYPLRSVTRQRTVRILGTHGVPAAYGGFETAAQHVAAYLVRQGWRVIVYCQVGGAGSIQHDTWQGIERVSIPVALTGWRGTSKFDLISIWHAAHHQDICLTFGYNTAVFNTIQRLRGIPNIINMDGIEWSRARWGLPRQAILYTNERIATVIGNHLIADHPEIEKHLLTRAPRRKISTITYGADAVTAAPTHVPLAYGLTPGQYVTLICRPIPENSILELVRGFSQTPRSHRLAILGHYDGDGDPYHRQVLDAASDDVVFLGAIYDLGTVAALRFHAALYLHGHTVGGTNPSLVEAMAAGNAVIAHDNTYNRWVAQDAAAYFVTSDDVAVLLDDLLASPARRDQMACASRRRHDEEFTWEHVAGQYDQLLGSYLPHGASGWARAVTRRFRSAAERSHD